VWYLGKSDPTEWSTAKDKDFSNWKFNPHYQKMFNNLMCWFFVKLHEDLANYYISEPKSRKSLKSYGWLNLDYDNIINALRAGIYPT
ncbi:3438_t:CDS:1, partial [Dentiscutata heterogama]